MGLCALHVREHAHVKLNALWRTGHSLNDTLVYHHHLQYMERYNKSAVKVAVSEYEAVAKKHGLTASELALAWCHSRWFVASTIIGATSL